MTRQFITFYIGDEWLGVDILSATEVCHGVTPVPVDLCPDYVCGLMNLRGKIITVLDLARKLGLEKRTLTPLSRIIVLKTNTELARQGLHHTTLADDPVGLLVDRIGDAVVIEKEDDLQPPPAHVFGINGYFVDRVLPVEQALLVVLKLPEVLALDDPQAPDRSGNVNGDETDEKEAHGER